MNEIERRLRAAVNPVSTVITGWWCRSPVRHVLTSHGPSANQRRLIRIRRHAARAAAPSAETMRARAAAIDELLAQQDHQT